MPIDADPLSDRIDEALEAAQESLNVNPDDFWGKTNLADVVLMTDGDIDQALALTAVVITFAVTMFLLAMANRSWQLSRDDEVQDDIEDHRIAELEGDEDIDEFAARDDLEDEDPPATGTAEVAP